MNEFQRPKFYFREWRKYRRLTQARLAELVDLTDSSISQLERGKQGFSVASLAAIAGALQCTPAELLMRDPNREDSFWPLFERAERLEGDERKRVLKVMLASLD